jgi:hypothetical protein
MRLYWKPICIFPPPLLFCFSPLTDGEQLRHCSNEKLFILLLRWCSTHTHTHTHKRWKHYIYINAKLFGTRRKMAEMMA